MLKINKSTPRAVAVIYTFNLKFNDAPIMGKNTYLHYSKRRQANWKNSTLH